MATEKTKSLFESIIDGAIEAVKRPFTVKRVSRAFESSKDSLEEQLMTIQAEQTTARENFVKAAKDGLELSSYIQKLIDLQAKVRSLKDAQTDLATEKEEFLG